jgi:hypothetical protein
MGHAVLLLFILFVQSSFAPCIIVCGLVYGTALCTKVGWIGGLISMYYTQ